MIVYQISIDGFFAGEVEADESPLEPGVFLIPGGCVETAPPPFDAETQRAKWTGAGWAVESIPPADDPDVGPEPQPVDLKAYIGTVRRQIEEQGVALPSGVIVKSDAESQGKIAQTIQSIDLGLIEEPVNWKAATGFVPLTRADLIEIGRAVAQHVQRSFNVEMAVFAQFEAGALTTAAEVDAAFIAAMSAPN